MLEITHNNIPEAIKQLIEKVCKIELLLLEKSNEKELEENDFLNIQQAAEFLNLSVPTMYGLKHRGEVPVMKRNNGKRLYFSKKQLSDWIKEGRRKTNSEIKAETDSFLATRRNKPEVKNHN